MPRTSDKTSGLCLMSQRGQIGDNWWAQQWLKPFEASPSKSEIEAARNAARRGYITRLELAPGRIRATGEEMSAEPVEIEIGFEVCSADVWDGVFALLQDSALYPAELLSGQLSEELAGILAEAGLPLLPGADEPRFLAGQDPEGRPGKGILAAAYLACERIDSDPLLLLLLRGEGRKDLLRRFRHVWGVPEELGFDPSAPQPLEAQLEHFYELPLHVVRDEDRGALAIDPARDFEGLAEELPLPPADHHDSHALSRLGFPPFCPTSERNVTQTLRSLYDDN